MNALRRRIDRFCVLHPNFGIPNLMLYIVIGNIAFYLLSMFSSMDSSSFYYTLCLSWDGLRHGQIWRLLSFSFLPSDNNAFFLLITCYFYYWIGSTLEREWGTAKFTIYYLSGIVLTVLGTILTSLVTGADYLVFGAAYVNLAMFFAFAMLYPDAQVLLFFIIPVKIKWLAIVDACLFAFNIFSALTMRSWINAVLPVVALLNFFIFFAPELGRFAQKEHRRSRQAAHFHNTVRQTQREQSAQGYRHKCAVCGRTDVTNPELQFRYCSKCAGYHCFCSDHIFNHVHFTEENP